MQSLEEKVAKLESTIEQLVELIKLLSGNQELMAIELSVLKNTRIADDVIGGGQMTPNS